MNGIYSSNVLPAAPHVHGVIPPPIPVDSSRSLIEKIKEYAKDFFYLLARGVAKVGLLITGATSFMVGVPLAILCLPIAVVTGSLCSLGARLGVIRKIDEESTEVGKRTTNFEVGMFIGLAPSIPFMLLAGGCHELFERLTKI